MLDVLVHLICLLNCHAIASNDLRQHQLCCSTTPYIFFQSFRSHSCSIILGAESYMNVTMLHFLFSVDAPICYTNPMFYCGILPLL
jgi:hypothetical protein